VFLRQTGTNKLSSPPTVPDDCMPLSDARLSIYSRRAPWSTAGDWARGPRSQHGGPPAEGRGWWRGGQGFRHPCCQGRSKTGFMAAIFKHHLWRHLASRASSVADLEPAFSRWVWIRMQVQIQI